jgi:hypothetical protein
MMSMLLTVLFTCLAFFDLGDFGLFHCKRMLSSTNACLITVKDSVAPFPGFAQQLMHTRCRIHREIATGQKHTHPAACNFVHWLPRYANTIIYRCIALLQLLYRWKHQSQKLEIPPRIWHITAQEALTVWVVSPSWWGHTARWLISRVLTSGTWT